MNNRSYRKAPLRLMRAVPGIMIGGLLAIVPGMAQSSGTSGMSKNQTASPPSHSRPMSGQTANQAKKAPRTSNGTSSGMTKSSSMKSKARRTSQMTGAAGGGPKPMSHQAGNQPKSPTKTQ